MQPQTQIRSLSIFSRWTTICFPILVIGLFWKSLAVCAAASLELEAELEKRRFMIGEPILFTLVVNNRSRIEKARVRQSHLSHEGGAIHVRFSGTDSEETVAARLPVGYFEAGDRKEVVVPVLSTRELQLILGDWRVFEKTGSYAFEVFCCRDVSSYREDFITSGGGIRPIGPPDVRNVGLLPFKTNRLHVEIEEFDARRYREIAERYLALALTGRYSAEDFREPVGNHVYGKALSRMNKDVAAPILLEMYERCSEVICRKLALEGLARTASELALEAIASIDFQRNGDELLILKTLRYLFRLPHMSYPDMHIRFMPAIPESIARKARLQFSEIMRKGYRRQEIEQDR